MSKTVKQQIEERINRESLRHCLNTTGEITKFMYGRYTPKTIDRISGDRAVSYKDMMDLLYKVHEEQPDLDIPGLVEKAILKATVEERSYDHPWRAHREFILNLKATCDIFVTHLMRQLKEEVSFDISDEILHIAGSRIRENEQELQKTRAWRMIEAQMAMLKKAGVTREIFTMTEEENEEAIKELERRAPKPIPRFHDDEDEDFAEEELSVEAEEETPVAVEEAAPAEETAPAEAEEEMPAEVEEVTAAVEEATAEEEEETPTEVKGAAPAEDIEVIWEEQPAEEIPAVEEAVTEEVAPAEETVEKPKRRTRKKAEETITEEIPAEEAEDSEEAAEKPKRRTRKKAEETITEETSAETAEEAEETPKRRTRKKAEETTTEETPAEEAEVPAEDVSEKPKKTGKKKIKKENEETAEKPKRKGSKKAKEKEAENEEKSAAEEVKES